MIISDFKTIRQTAAAGILPERELRNRLVRGALPHIKIGNRVYVNIPLLLERLTAESALSAHSLEGGGGVGSD